MRAALSVVGMMLAGAGATAATFTWTPRSAGGSPKWGTANNWTNDAGIAGKDAYPGAGGRGDDEVVAAFDDKAPVITCDGEFCVASLRVAAGVQVTVGGDGKGALEITERDGLRIAGPEGGRPGGAMEVGSGGALRLSGKRGDGEHRIDGELRVIAPDAMLKIDNGHSPGTATLEGGGRLTLAHPHARVFIASAAQDELVLALSVEGQGFFDGAGELVNRGQIRAKGVLRFGPSLDLSDSNAPGKDEWVAAGYAARLQFENAQVGPRNRLSGDFAVLDGGRIRLHGAGIETAGGLTGGGDDCGAVETSGEAGVCFTWNAGSKPSSCPGGISRAGSPADR